MNNANNHIKLPSTANVLSIGGIDSRSGGGIMSDYHIFRKMNTFPFTVTTSIVTVGDVAINIYPLSADIIMEQLGSIEHLNFSAIKIGFLPNLETIKIVTDFINHRKRGTQILIDPVISFKESSDTDALKSNADEYFNALIDLISIADIITPNLDEWDILTNNDYFKKKFVDGHSLAVVVKDIDPHHDMAVDRIYPQYNTSPDYFDIELPRIKSQTIFGAGCTLSAVITALIGSLKDYQNTASPSGQKVQILREIVQIAKGKTHISIQNGINVCKNSEFTGGPVGDID